MAPLWDAGDPQHVGAPQLTPRGATQSPQPPPIPDAVHPGGHACAPPPSTPMIPPQPPPCLAREQSHFDAEGAMCATLVCRPPLNCRSDGSGCLAAPGRQPQAITEGRGAEAGTQPLSEGWAGGAASSRSCFHPKLGSCFYTPMCTSLSARSPRSTPFLSPPGKEAHLGPQLTHRRVTTT